MGLYQRDFRFDGPTPDLEAVRAEIRRRLGSLRGLEGLELDGHVVIARSMLDPFTHPVVCAVLEELGGQPVRLHDGTPVSSRAPAWARHPLHELSWTERMTIRFRWWGWLFGTAPRRPV